MSKSIKAMAAALLSLASISVPTANAADMVTVMRNDGSPCGEQRYLNKITERFDYQVKHVPHLPQVAILDFLDIRQRRYEPVLGEIQPIERTYCKATAALSNGHMRDVWYLIEGGMGFASIGDNVEFCVDGFDRWMVYNGRCRVLR